MQKSPTVCPEAHLVGQTLQSLTTVLKSRARPTINGEEVLSLIRSIHEWRITGDAPGDLAPTLSNAGGSPVYTQLCFIRDIHHLVDLLAWSVETGTFDGKVLHATRRPRTPLPASMLNCVEAASGVFDSLYGQERDLLEINTPPRWDDPHDSAGSIPTTISPRVALNPSEATDVETLLEEADNPQTEPSRLTAMQSGLALACEQSGYLDAPAVVTGLWLPEYRSLTVPFVFSCGATEDAEALVKAVVAE